MKCPKCQGTNIWYNAKNDNWSSHMWYCPKCEIDIETGKRYPYQVDEDGNLYHMSVHLGKRCSDFNFIDVYRYYHDHIKGEYTFFPVDVENNTTPSKIFTIEHQYLEQMRDLLNIILEEIEKENE